MRPIDADVLKQHIDKLPALPDGNFAGNHSALKALINMQPTIEPSANCSEFPNNSDTISRQAVKDIFTELYGISAIGSVFDKYEWADICETTANELPSIQPERKTGRWIYRKELSKYSHMWSCSECNEKTTDSIMGKPRPNFCPLCGADMRGEQDG